MKFSTVAKAVVKASPYILFGVGVVSFGGCIYTTYKATTALDPILEEHKREKEQLELEKQEDQDYETDPDKLAELEKDVDKRMRHLYFHTWGRIGRLYLPTMGLAALSLGSFGWSAGILNARYIAAAGLLTERTGQFDAYRERVIERYGEDVDEELFYDVKKEKITVEETDPETGKTKKVKKEMYTGEPAGDFTYRWEKYDWETGRGSTQWDSSSIYGLTYITQKIKQFQNQLDAGKPVHFDRLLDELGFEEANRKGEKNWLMMLSAKEHMAGWLPGDTILCGLEEEDKYEGVYRFISGSTPDVTLRFNPRRDILGLCDMEIKNLAQVGYRYIPVNDSPEAIEDKEDRDEQ